MEPFTALCRKGFIFALVKRIIYILVIFFQCFSSAAQELVPNGSFEAINSCPTNLGQITLAYPWDRPNYGTPDLYNSCNAGPLSVPTNAVGTQFAYTGNGYVGCHIYGFREYIQAPLLDTLKAGKEYCLTFYVSLPDNFLVSCHNIGAYFSDSAVFYPYNDSTPLPFVPQVENTAANPLTSKTEWMPITGSFIAQGTETHIIIGNFRTNQNSDTTTLTPSINNWIYYYIDDVSLTECPSPVPPVPETNLAIPNVFTPNGDGINDLFLIESTGIENIHCEIFDRWGIKVASISRLNEGWDGRTTSGQEAIEGVYYYLVNARNEKGEKITKKGFVQLLR